MPCFSRFDALLACGLAPAEMQAILDACTRLRDRFFFALLHESGCRAGEALGLRHEDIAAAECEITIVARENANGARAKSGGRTRASPHSPARDRRLAKSLTRGNSARFE